MEKKTEIDNIPIAEIIPYLNNPRKNDSAVDIVAKSIEEFGFKVQIILDKENVIIAGHTRLKAAQKLGLTEVPVIWADDLNEEQVKAFRIMDNKSSELAEWDMPKLETEIKDLADLGYDLDLTGISKNDISDLLGKEVKEDDFEIPNEPKYKIKRGEILELGNHRLMCGDSTKKEDVENLMNGQKADMVLTDPPYGVDYSEKNKFLNAISRGNRNQTPIVGDKDLDIKDLIKTFLKNTILTDKNTIYIFSSGKNIAEMINGFKDAGCYYSQDLKWIKNNHVLGRLDYNPKSENILYGWKGTHNFYGGFQTDVLEFNKPHSSKEHPTMKPIELLSELIKHGSMNNNTIYDGFGGSGSTLIASEQTNRKCYIMELDEKYCSVIIERWEKLTGKKAVKL